MKPDTNVPPDFDLVDGTGDGFLDGAQTLEDAKKHNQDLKAESSEGKAPLEMLFAWERLLNWHTEGTMANTHRIELFEINGMLEAYKQLGEWEFTGDILAAAALAPVDST